ncbi:hypothetical protein C8T65DRAFT_137478 [Cerioporus squamosus]|nr:hypothetical protein C8T65DRAFT_137478 [Cerioporus squamosus]
MLQDTALSDLTPFESPTIPPLDNTFGAFFLCTALGFMLYGLTVHQTYRYFNLYPTDGPYLKILVGGLLVLDTLHSVTTMHVCYYYLALNYFNPENLATGVWSIQSTIMETGTIVFVSHCFFARRLFFLADRKALYLIGIGILLLSELSMCIAATVEVVKRKTFSAFADDMWLIWATLAIAVTVDVLCSIGLTYYLRRNRTGFKKTDSMVDILMLYSINTGLCTSLCTLGALVCAILMPKNLIFCGVYVVASKLYSNSLLAVLNSRRSILEYGMAYCDSASLGLQATTPHAEHPGLLLRSAAPRLTLADSKGKIPPTRGRPGGVVVKITRETVIDISPEETDSSKRELKDTSEAIDFTQSRSDGARV